MPLFSKKSKKKKREVDQIVDVARESEEEVESKERDKDIGQEFLELESRPEGLTTAEVQVRPTLLFIVPLNCSSEPCVRFFYLWHSSEFNSLPGWPSS